MSDAAFRTLPPICVLSCYIMSKIGATVLMLINNLSKQPFILTKLHCDYASYNSKQNAKYIIKADNICKSYRDLSEADPKHQCPLRTSTQKCDRQSAHWCRHQFFFLKSVFAALHVLECKTGLLIWQNVVEIQEVTEVENLITAQWSHILRLEHNTGSILQPIN